MTTEQIIQLLQACKAQGVSFFKCGELHVEFERSVQAASPTIPQVRYVDPANTSNAVQTEITPEEEKEIQHKVEELTSIMKLDDNELIDRMFPLPEAENEGVA